MSFSVDEDHIRVAQLSEILTGIKRVRVHQRGVVPRPSRLRAVVGTLNLYVVFPALGIPREHVETNAAPLEALDGIFGLRLDNLQVFLADDDPQHQLYALRRVLEAFRHEVVVHEPEVVYQGKIFRIHHVCRTPRRRLSDDGPGRFTRFALHTFRHVTSFRFFAQGHSHLKRRWLNYITILRALCKIVKKNLCGANRTDVITFLSQNTLFQGRPTPQIVDARLEVGKRIGAGGQHC